MEKIYIEYLDEEVKRLNYAHEGDAGMDICANEDITIGPGETALVHTGVKIAVPRGIEIQVRPRSGISLNTPIRIANSPGTIDSGYRDEICIIVENTSKEYEWYLSLSGHAVSPLKKECHTYSLDEKGNKQGWYEIKKGQRIAQLVFSRYEEVSPIEIEDIGAVGEDRGGGFGSTGV